MTCVYPATYCIVNTEMEAELKELAVELYDIQAVKFGEFKTKIGLMTPVYFDLRVMISHPKVMFKVAKALWRFANSSTDGKIRVCGVPYTALPLATLISVEYSVPMLMKRKEPKSYGTKKMIEGAYSPGDNCIIIEDVITSGSSILETVDALKKEQLKITQALIIVDREQNGRKNLESQGIEVKCLYKVTQMMEYLLEAGKITPEVVEEVAHYLRTNQVPNIIQDVPNNRLKLSYSERARLANNSITSKLLELIEWKMSNLCLAADLTKADAILRLAELAGPHIAVLKTHVDIIEDFSDNFVNRLKTLAKKHEFMLMEDRKFGDIGNTVSLQYKRGMYKIADWADLITVHPVSGKPVIDALRNGLRGVAEMRGIFLVAEMSCQGALTNGDYVKNAVSMAEGASDIVVGLVCQSNLFSRPGLVQLTPGVKLFKSNDEMGQQYNDPQFVVDAGADLVVVGRGITEASDKLAAVLEYKKQLWHAYEKRISKYDNI